MALPGPKDRLHPALLDRLIDTAPDQQHEPREARVISRGQLHAAVLRDLAWLLNTTRLGGDAAFGRHRAACHSVLNFGLPALAGGTVSTLDLVGLEQAIAQAIRDFEPRIRPASLEVRALAADALLERHNIVSISIRGILWAQPVPIELLLRTEVDLETGVVELRDLGSAA